MAAVPMIPAEAGTAWDALPGPVLLLDAQARAQGANAAMARLAARPPAALLGAGWHELLGDGALGALTRALHAGAEFRLVLPMRAGAGWIECAGRWLDSGQACLCLLHDVSEGRAAQAEAQAQASLFRLLADNVPVLIAYYRAGDMRCQFANAQYAQTFGRDERSIVGCTLAEVIGERSLRSIQPHIDTLLGEGRAVAYERELPEPDGGRRFIEVNLLPHCDDTGRVVVGAFVLIADITRHRVAERALRESEERLAKFMQASAEGILFHQGGIISDVNPPICQLTGYTPAEMVGRAALDFIAPDHVAQAAAVMAAGQETSFESVLIDKHGSRVPVEFIVRTMLRNGLRMRMAIVRDLRDRHAAQAHIHHLAHHDPLTGLPNRMAFMERLDQQMATVDTRLALLFIDLDHFKRVNDSLGHLVGDTLLRTVAQRIVASLRATDVVGRFGGDEFLVLLPGMAGEDHQRRDVEEVAQKLLAVIAAPVDADGRPISVSSSIGIALHPGDGDTPAQLIKNADSAMYLAKARGRANHQFFDPGMATSAYAALVMEGELAQALERGEFALHFQPQVGAVDGELVGAEALLRWNHPERGLLLPDAFIPVAERQRLMLPIGLWVMQEAARCAERWHAMGLDVGPVAINLSTVQFEWAGFVDAVAQVLPPRNALGPGRAALELELTERMLMEDLGDVKQRLQRLKAMGLRISVDDFGTGYSSLGHLKELPIDKVKIDRSFVHDLPGNRDSAAITRAIIQMGASLGMSVMAEGVENEAQREFLAANGCGELQGLLISAPLSAPDFEAWVLGRRAPPP